MVINPLASVEHDCPTNVIQKPCVGLLHGLDRVNRSRYLFAQGLTSLLTSLIVALQPTLKGVKKYGVLSQPMLRRIIPNS